MALNRTTLIASLFGNALEAYDFILYANFAPIIAKLFFPTHDPIVSLLLTFAVFASGFLIRPLGAVVFGYIGDHIGRRMALITSMCVITVPTLLIGFIPSYQQIGFMAPLLLTILRLLQGLAVSGELNSATTFLVEHISENRRGLAGSLVMGTAFFGILLGALISAVMAETLPKEVLYSWGWRVPFWFGGVIGIVGIILRLQSMESPKFLELSKQDTKTPLRFVISHFYKKIILSFCLTIIMAVGNYMYIAFIVTFLVQFQGFSLKNANIINLISMFVMLLFFPLCGILSDKFGRKPVFKVGLYGFILLSFPIFWLLSQKQFYLALIGDLLFCLTLAPIASLIPTILAELFPTKIRNSGTTISYNLCLALFGGTAPLISLYLVNTNLGNFGPAIYLMITAILSLLSLTFIKESHQLPLE